MRSLILTININETSSWPEKITAQNERYLNHIADSALLKGVSKGPEKITAQNERYLNHIFQRNNLLSFD